MTSNLNTHARIRRALRNNQKIYSAGEAFRRFKWFSLAIILLLPIYPSLSLLGTDVSARSGDYDETTIITAYEGDEGMEGSYVNEMGLVSTDFDVVTERLKKKEILNGSGTTVPSLAQEKAKIHIVQAGESVATIAKRYGISADAVFWANDISSGDPLTAGMKLRIPPVSGVVYTVKSGDTISEIAGRYDVDADDIVRVNGLANIAQIRAGMDLMIPGAAQKIAHADTAVGTASQKTDTSKISQNSTLKPIPTKEPTRTPTVVDSKTGLKSRYAVKYTGLSRGFAWGNCTYYVAQNKNVSWRGNANSWIKNAKAKGIPTGKTPIPGAIIQFGGAGYNRYYGHVGIVADVTDDFIIIKDMNYRRLNEVTIRKISKRDSSIVGYIYVD